MPRFNSSFSTSRQLAPDDSLETSVRFLESRIPYRPEILIVLGSGLGAFADKVEAATVVPYEEIPGFKSSTAPGHRGRLVVGKVAGKTVALMQGRFHVYEGYTSRECAYPVEVLSGLGAKTLVATCAAGGIHEKYLVGDFVLVGDSINITYGSPLIGFDHTKYGERFIDMSDVFDKELRRKVKEQFPMLHEGVYFYMPGPQFETLAEIRAIKALGGDLVGMSLVHEAVMAKRCGLSVLGICLVTNFACGVGETPPSENDVHTEGKKACVRFDKLLRAILPKL